MGMFDTVNFACPNCDANVDVQSKAGDCILRDISQWDVPTNIATDICGNEAYCEACKKSFTVTPVENALRFYNKMILK